ncbi:MAG: GNAT family N-acetyltransferase [Xanthomonadales bacterium]|nr:GNAT family N-acetyltransferase [Xanthomonadales bacterium]
MPRAFVGACADRPAGITLRPVVDADHAFLRDLYAQVRAAELAPLPWSSAAKREFLSQQFTLQHQHYVQNYKDAQLLLIEREAAPIGRIYVFRGPEEIRLMDIALLVDMRGQGIGSALLHELMVEARLHGAQLTLHVEPNNPAQRLYQRMGFTLIEHRGVYDFLGWRGH